MPFKNDTDKIHQTIEISCLDQPNIVLGCDYLTINSRQRFDGYD